MPGPRVPSHVWLDSWSVEKHPLMLAAGRVCRLTPALRQRDMDTHSAPSFQWGARAGKAPLCDRQHTFLPSLSSLLSLSLFYFFPALFLSPSVVTTERGLGMCGWLSKLTCLSERHESTAGRLPKTTTFRSLVSAPLLSRTNSATPCRMGGSFHFGGAVVRFLVIHGLQIIGLSERLRIVLESGQRKGPTIILSLSRHALSDECLHGDLTKWCSRKLNMRVCSKWFTLDLPMYVCLLVCVLVWLQMG